VGKTDLGQKVDQPPGFDSWWLVVILIWVKLVVGFGRRLGRGFVGRLQDFGRHCERTCWPGAWGRFADFSPPPGVIPSHPC
jgi:hypothetical protein